VIEIRVEIVVVVSPGQEQVAEEAVIMGMDI
jgi:hypothetical protein